MSKKMSKNLTQGLERLERQQEEIVRLLARATGEPDAGEWTAAQHIEHLALSNESAARQAETPSDRQGGGATWLMLPMVCLLLRFGPSVPVPTTMDLEPRGDVTPDEAVAHWTAARAQFRAQFDAMTPADARRIVFRHSVAGPLDAAQTLQLGLAHGEYHRRKIARLTA